MHSDSLQIRGLILLGQTRLSIASFCHRRFTQASINQMWGTDWRKPINVEVDTAWCRGLINFWRPMQESLFTLMQPVQSSVILRTYTGEMMLVAGGLQVNVQYVEQTKRFRLIVVAGIGHGPSLLHRDCSIVFTSDFGHLIVHKIF